MDDKEAIDVLKKLHEKDSLSAEEKEAVMTAIGVLGWTSLSKSRIKRLGARRRERNNP